MWTNLYSTNYPESYNSRENCGLLIQNGAGRIVLRIVAFSVDINHASVNIYDGVNEQAELLATYSGRVFPESFTSTGSYLYIKHTSDAFTPTLPGFHMQFKIEG